MSLRAISALALFALTSVLSAAPAWFDLGYIASNQSIDIDIDGGIDSQRFTDGYWHLYDDNEQVVAQGYFYTNYSGTEYVYAYGSGDLEGASVSTSCANNWGIATISGLDGGYYHLRLDSAAQDGTSTTQDSTTGSAGWWDSYLGSVVMSYSIY